MRVCISESVLFLTSCIHLSNLLVKLAISAFTVCMSPQWGAADAEIKSHLVRTQSLNVLPLEPGVGKCIAIRATLTARDFFLAYFYPSGPFTCILSKTSPDFSCVGCGYHMVPVCTVSSLNHLKIHGKLITDRNESTDLSVS